MNCRTVQDQLAHAVDDVQTAPAQSAIAEHVKSCAQCRRFADNLLALRSLVKGEAESVPLPSSDDLWRDVRAHLNTPGRSRHVAPLVWITAPLAAAAALAFAFIPTQQSETHSVISDTAVVQANFVEIEDPDSTAMVYVDKESGWLVVWADDPSINKG